MCPLKPAKSATAYNRTRSIIAFFLLLLTAWLLPDGISAQPLLATDDHDAYFHILENIFKNRSGRERYFQRDVYDFKTEILPMKEFFIRNATMREKAKPLECVNTLRAGLETLFYGRSAIPSSPFRNTGRSLFRMTGANRMADAMELLSDSGCINDYKDIYFYGRNRNGDTVIINEQNFSIPGNFDTSASIIDMAGSVWHALLSMIPKSKGWSVFGVSVSNGYHAVTLLVNHTGPVPQVYWADQTGNHAVTAADRISIAYAQQFGWERFTEHRTPLFRSLDEYCLYAARTFLKDNEAPRRKHMPVFRIFKISKPSYLYRKNWFTEHRL